MKTTNIIIRKSIDPSWPRWAVSGKVADTQWFKTLEAAEKYAGFKFVEPVSELAALRAENEKLRAALTDIAIDQPDGDKFALMAIASDALAKEAK